MDQLTDEGRTAVDTLTALPTDQKRLVVTKVQSLDPDTFPAGDEHRTRIWTTLLTGLFVLALTSIIGAVVVALQDKDAASLFVLATAIVTGTIGLFAKSPI